LIAGKAIEFPQSKQFMIGDKKQIKHRRAFTLVELLVVMSIFSVVLVSTSDIYVQTMRYGKQIVSRAKLQADSRNALEAIARAVRVSNINYASLNYNGGSGTLPPMPVGELDLINPRTGDKVNIRLDSTDTNCYSDGKSSPCINVSTDGGSTWAPLSPKGVKIDSLKFYISPNKDPFSFDQAAGTYASSNQPVVTIAAQFRSLGARASDDWVYPLQTAVTPRLYLR
jgi:prepilin-type N-terminal cleavage/methylation domain-containing protein